MEQSPHQIELIPTTPTSPPETPVLLKHSDAEAVGLLRASPVTPAIKHRLYVSHFLSTWNSRVFEFGAVLCLASIFPRTLLPMSLYAFVRGASAVALSPVLARYAGTMDRLPAVRLSIGEWGFCCVRGARGWRRIG